MQFLLQSDKNNATLHEEQYTFLILSRSVLLRMRNILENSVEKIKTHILLTFFFLENHVLYEKT